MRISEGAETRSSSNELNSELNCEEDDEGGLYTVSIVKLEDFTVKRTHSDSKDVKAWSYFGEFKK